MNPDPLQSAAIDYALRLCKRRLVIADDLLRDAAKIAEFLKGEPEPQKKIGFESQTGQDGPKSGDA